MKYLKYAFIVVLTVNLPVVFAQENDSTKARVLEQIKAMKLMSQPILELKGQKLPGFDLTSLNGQIISSESLNGKPSLINFWFSNCAPCIEEMPVLNELESHFKGDINFVAITFQSEQEVASFLDGKEFNFTHLIDAKDYLSSYGVFGYPKTLILDEKLNIVEIKSLIPKDPKTKEPKIEEFRNDLMALLTELKKR